MSCILTKAGRGFLAFVFVGDGTLCSPMFSELIFDFIAMTGCTVLLLDESVAACGVVWLMLLLLFKLILAIVVETK